MTTNPNGVVLGADETTALADRTSELLASVVGRIYSGSDPDYVCCLCFQSAVGPWHDHRGECVWSGGGPWHTACLEHRHAQSLLANNIALHTAVRAVFPLAFNDIANNGTSILNSGTSSDSD